MKFDYNYFTFPIYLRRNWVYNEYEVVNKITIHKINNKKFNVRFSYRLNSNTVYITILLLEKWFMHIFMHKVIENKVVSKKILLKDSFGQIPTSG